MKQLKLDCVVMVRRITIDVADPGQIDMCTVEGEIHPLNAADSAPHKIHFGTFASPRIVNQVAEAIGAEFVGHIESKYGLSAKDKAAMQRGKDILRPLGGES